MQRATSILAVAIALTMAGCMLRGKPAAKAPVAVSKPPVAPAPSPPPPLSIPQTNVQLPTPQPLDPNALATTQPQEELPAPPPMAPPKAPTKSGRSTQTATPRVESPPAATPEPGRTPVREVVSSVEEQGRLREEANNHMRETRVRVDAAQSRRLNNKQRTLIDRIQTFLRQSEEAGRRGDWRQASELAGKAVVLAKDLQ